MGIFRNQSSLYRYYRATLEFRSKIMGGIPKDPEIIEAWLRTKGFLTGDDELSIQLRRTIDELGLEPPTADATDEERFAPVEKASEAVAAVKHTNGFKRHETLGLYIEGRQVKAALKESASVALTGTTKGKYAKSFRNWLAERVFVMEDVIPLGVAEPTSVDLVIGHVQTPKGKKSTLSYHEYVWQPRIVFHIMDMKVRPSTKEKGAPTANEPSVTMDEWADIWEAMQEEGIGAMRSASYGRFDIVAFDEIDKADVPAMAAGIAATTAALAPAPRAARPTFEKPTIYVEQNGATPDAEKILVGVS